MSAPDWKTLVGTIAPTLATAFGTPLAGAGVAILCQELFGKASTDQTVNEQELTKAFAGGSMTPEQQAAVATADANMKAAMIAADVTKTQIAADTEKSYLADVADARAHNANTVGILRLGYLINACSYLCILIILYGCYKILTNTGMLDGVDPGLAAAVGSVVGAIVQYLISNSTQANSFFFGSSPTSRQQAQQMSDSVIATVKASAKKDAATVSKK